MKNYRILIIEDEQLLCKSYEFLLKKLDNSSLFFHIDIANTFDQAIVLISGASYDLVILDIRLPNPINGEIENGEILGEKIRNKNFKTKILVITAQTNKYSFYTIFKNIKPEGFLTKYELDKKQFTNAILTLLNTNTTYYSNSINKYLNTTINNNYKLDNLDIKLLYLLSNCLSTQEISNNLLLSPSGIEKRKRKLARFFDLENSKTSRLVIAAKKHGFLE